MSDFRRRIMMGISTQEVPYPDNYEDDGWIWAYYEVVDTENPTQILYDGYQVINYIQSTILVDGVETEKTISYTFSTTGEHLVKMKASSSSLRQYTFRGVTALKRLYIPDTVATVNAMCYGCTNLTHVFLPTTITNINTNSFRGCSSLYRINLENTEVSAIGEETFNGCIALKKVDFYNMAYLTSFGLRACYNMGLVRLKLGSTVSSMSRNNTFYNNTSLVEADLSNTTIPSFGTGVFQLCSSLEKLLLPSTVTSLPENFVASCGKLTTLNFNDLVNLQSIGLRAFNGAKVEGDVVLPSLTSIANSGLANNHITSLTLNSIVTIGASSFTGTYITYAILGDGVTTIGENAFNSCPYLETVTVKAATPPSLSLRVFGGCPNLAHIYVPAGSVEAYKTATRWSDYASKIEAIPTT